MSLAGLLPLLVPGPATVGALALPSATVPAATRCAQVDEYFRSGPERSALLIVDAERPALIGLVCRGRFLQVMAGPFGFGRALLANAPVGRVAVWNPVVLDADTPVHQAAAAVLQRSGDARYDEVVVRLPAGWGTLSAAAVLESLSRLLAEQAMLDALTGLATREVLLHALTEALADGSSTAGVALLFLDLDRFKQVNDAHGHNVGDRVLQAVATRLRAICRPQDLIARLGGDEFAVMLALPAGESAAATRTATAVAERLLTEIVTPMPLGGISLLVGVSIGVAISAPTGSDPDTLLCEADLAMYAAKRAGGDRIHTVRAVGSQLAAPLRGLAIHDTLRRALEDGQFVLHYQPIQELTSGATVSAEALIRWQHPVHGLLPPGDFLPAAHASGLIIDLDRWVLTTGARQLAAWDQDPKLTAPRYINLNVSAAHLAHPQLHEHVLLALRDGGLPADRLRLELPETATLAELRTAEPALLALRDEGVKLTLDDLGAGSSTLRHLSELPVDGVKIDASFIGGLTVNDRDTAVVRLLIDLAHNLKVNVTAEGIETPEQLRLLTTLGCTYGQGFYLGRPVPVTPDSPPPWLTRPSPATRPAHTH